jgi:DNA-binding NarL/FixJ family response regulator
VAVRVVVAEDNYLVREGICRLVASMSEMEVAGACTSYDELIGMVEKLSPDVVLTDIRMPPTSTDEGIRAANELRLTHPNVGVVVLSQFASPAYALSLLAQGSEGRAYLLKDRIAEGADLADAIRAVAAGDSIIDAKVVDQLVNVRSRLRRSALEFLTVREHEVLSEMAQGRSNAAIASALALSERAVEKHINSIFSKLQLREEPNVNRRVKAVLLFLASSDGG